MTRSLLSSFMVTVVTTVSHYFMFGFLVMDQIIIYSSFIVTLVTPLSHSFMFGLYMNNQVTLCSSLIVTLLCTVGLTDDRDSVISCDP